MATVKILLRQGNEATEVTHDLVSDIEVGPVSGLKDFDGGELHGRCEDFLHIEMMDDSAHYCLVNVVGWHRKE